MKHAGESGMQISVGVEMVEAYGDQTEASNNYFL